MTLVVVLFAAASTGPLAGECACGGWGVPFEVAGEGGEYLK